MLISFLPLPLKGKEIYQVSTNLVRCHFRLPLGMGKNENYYLLTPDFQLLTSFNFLFLTLISDFFFLYLQHVYNIQIQAGSKGFNSG